MKPLTLLLAAMLLPLPALATASPTSSLHVDPTTPHTQNGLTLMALTRGDAQGQYRFPAPGGMSFLSGPSSNGPAGGIGLWVRGTAPKPVRLAHPIIPGHPFFMPPMNSPTATAQAADGEIVPAQCQTVFMSQTYGKTPTAPLYLIALPGGYPPHFGPVTIHVFAGPGQQAQWRLDDLPPSYHAITGSVLLHSAFHQGGVSLKAAAWQDNGPPGANADQWRGVRFQLTGTVPAGTSWLAQITQAQLEWEALPPSHQTLPYASYFQSLCTLPLGGAQSATPFANPANMGQGMISTPYANANHYLRLTGQVVRLATMRETAIFHNLNIHTRVMPKLPHQPYESYSPPPMAGVFARPQTVVTPSGISITLLPLSDLPQNQFYGGGMPDSVQMLLRFNGPAPSIGPISLPKSPLARRYHKLVMLTLNITGPLRFQQMFPVGGMAYQPFQPDKTPTEYLVTLVGTGRGKQVSRIFNGHKFMMYVPPPLPKYVGKLTLTFTQQAELHTVPIGFLLPISRQAPARPVFKPR